MAEQTLAGRYRLGRQLATGRIFSLWEGTDRVLERQVVLKVLHPHLAVDSRLKERFIGTARTAAALVHPNVVAVYDTGEDSGVPFIVNEYLGGGSLRQHLRAGPLEVKQAAALGAGVAAGLAHAHSAGLVHGYVTPANILFSERGQAKVGDFGVALASVPEGTAMTSGLLDSIAYVAPEQVTTGESSHHSDIFALGVILFECLTGKVPFDASDDLQAAAARLESEPTPPSVLKKGIPPALDEIILKSLAREPRDRYPDANQMSAALALQAETDLDRRPAPRRRAGRRARPRQPSFLRSEGRLLFWTVLVVALGAALVYLVLRFSVTSPQEVIEGLFPGRGEGSQAIEIRSAGSFDPEGDDRSENEDDVGNAFDGDLGTAWATSHYSSADFGGLKEGVGLFFDLGDSTEIRRVEVRTISGGWQGSIRFSDDARTWSTPEASAEAGEEAEFETAGRHRYWMVWITRLTQTEGRGRAGLPFSVSISEVELFGGSG
jgi:tRNA A-37 threonylcarbamoyl transferase component Bud32